MATHISPSEAAELRRKISQLENRQTSVTALPLSKAEVKIPTWLALVNVGTILTVVFAIVAFSYYLGSLNNTVSTTALRVERLENAVTGASKDSLSGRMAVVETKLGSVETKLDAIDRKLDKLSHR